MFPINNKRRRFAFNLFFHVICGSIGIVWRLECKPPFFIYKNYTMKSCKFCWNEINEEALKCQHCGEFWDPKYKWRWVQVKPYLFSFLFMKTFCTNCYYEGNPKIIKTGSLTIEILLWCCGIIPWWIYWIHRNKSRYCACRECGSDMINKL